MHSLNVPSTSRPDRTYEVVLVGNKLICDCPRFTFGPRAGKSCRHVQIVRQAATIIKRCLRVHPGSSDGRLCGACLVEVLAVAARKVRREYVLKATMREKVAAARKRKQ